MPIVEDANYRGMSSRQRADYASVSAAVITDVCNFNEDTIAVHGRSDCVGGYKNIPRKAGLHTFIERSGFWNDEAVAVAVHGQTANNLVAALGGLRMNVPLAQVQVLFILLC
jgi:hypothetical protein